VDFCEDSQRGFALAAASCRDRDGALGAAGLAGGVATQATTWARRLAALDGPARQRFVREQIAWLAAPAPPTEPAPSWPPRALGLLASSVEREVGRRWLEQAPRPRTGYAPDPKLLALLRRLSGSESRA
jgi:hypothetical protein